MLEGEGASQGVATGNLAMGGARWINRQRPPQARHHARLQLVSTPRAAEPQPLSLHLACSGIHGREYLYIHQRAWPGMRLFTYGCIHADARMHTHTCTAPATPLPQYSMNSSFYYSSIYLHAHPNKCTRRG